MTSKNMPEFKSKLAPLLRDFINEKRTAGYVYMNEAKFLKVFDRFVVDNRLDKGTVDDEIISLYCQKMGREIENSRKYRVDALKQFIKYLHSLGIKAAMPPRFKFIPRKLPYIPSFHEIQLFFKYIDEFSKRNQELTELQRLFAFYEAPVLFRFYYCLGLRFNEARNIRLAELNLETGRLLITHAKADKHRIVYLSSDLLELTRRYLKTLNGDHYFSEWLFPGKDGDAPIRAESIRIFFRNAWAHGVSKATNKPQRPSIHGLRHCFVIHKIAMWASEGRDVHLLLPYLSKHLGHQSVADTYYYFHQIEHMCPSVRPFLQSRQSLSRSVYEFQSC